MTSILILITAVVFFYIGKYSQTTKEQEIVKEIQSKLTKNKITTGAVKTPTPEQIRKKGTIQEQVDKSMSTLLKGLLK